MAGSRWSARDCANGFASVDSAITSLFVRSSWARREEGARTSGRASERLRGGRYAAGHRSGTCERAGSDCGRYRTFLRSTNCWSTSRKSARRRWPICWQQRGARREESERGIRGDSAMLLMAAAAGSQQHCAGPSEYGAGCGETALQTNQAKDKAPAKRLRATIAGAQRSCSAGDEALRETSNMTRRCGTTRKRRRWIRRIPIMARRPR